MTDKIINYEELQKEYGEMADMIIQNFESTCFDQRMEGLVQGMLNKDWVTAMTNSHTLKGSAGYIKAAPFIDTVKVFQQFVKDHCLRIEYPDNQPATVDRPQYSLKEEFDDEKKLQAYEFFHPIIEQARLLKKEMSKYSKSEFPEEIYVKDGQQIRKLHEELKDKLEIARRGTVMRSSQRTIQTNSHPRDQTKQQYTRNTSVLDAVQVLDPPQNNKCCDKCIIF